MINGDSPTQPVSLNLEEALQQAVEHHQAGLQEEAVALYQSILQVDPCHAEANNNMGVMAVQVKQPAAGLSYFMAALDADPSRERYWLNYIDALFQADQVETAREVLALARKQGLHGDEVDTLAMRLEGRAVVAEEAEAENPHTSREPPPAPSAVPTSSQITPKARPAKPDKSAGKSPTHKGKSPGPKEMDSLVNLFSRGNFTEAATLAQAMTVRFPLHEFGWKALGAALKQTGRTADALLPMQKAAALSPRDVEAHFNLGVTLQDLGRLDEAEACYRRALEINPDYVDAHSNLGVILQGQCRLSEAETSLRRAMEIKPDSAKTLSNLGVVLQHLGRLDEAEASYRRALQINPDNPEVHNNLGNILKGLGRPSEAEASYRRALQINPDYADAHNNLGVILHDLGRMEEAEGSFRQALKIKPDIAEVHCSLGAVLHNLGRLEEAEASYRRALEIKPCMAEAMGNLGITLKELGRPDEAEASYRQVIQAHPDSAEAHHNLGVSLHDRGQPAEAEANFRKALEIKPDFAEAHNSLGIFLMRMGRPYEAEASFRRALVAHPDFTQANINLGVAQRDLGQLDEAMASCRRALEIDPESTEAHLTVGNILQDLWQLDGAVTSYRRALEIKPDYAIARSNLLFCLSHDEAVDAQELFAEHCRFGEQFEAGLRAKWPQHSNSRDPERCLQVGFVSADLCDHSVTYFIEPVLAHLATYPQLSLHAFYNRAFEDLVTQRLQRYMKHWHSIAGLADEVVAQRVHDAGIDILIDLSGHSAGNRLLTFARKPAPIQASWMGYPGTSGMQAMDYYIADRFFLPDEGFSKQFTEAFARLPASAPFLPFQGAPAVNTLPTLSNGYVTFGSFNRAGKISRSVVALWAQVLRALPNSRMLLAGMPAEDKEGTLIEWFSQEGIERDRLSFHIRSGMDSYLSLHHLVDICLDTFPYNGGTTTLHALWMGVPTLTLAGETPASRSGACVLGHVGLEAFVAHDAEDFLHKGLIWASNLAALQDIRAGLRERFAKSAMSQPALIAQSLQCALRIMWQRWCKGLPAESFEVTGQGMANSTLAAGDSLHQNP